MWLPTKQTQTNKNKKTVWPLLAEGKVQFWPWVVLVRTVQSSELVFRGLSCHWEKALSGFCFKVRLADGTANSDSEVKSLPHCTTRCPFTADGWDDDLLCSQTPERLQANCNIAPIPTEARLLHGMLLYIQFSFGFLVRDFSTVKQLKIIFMSQHCPNRSLGGQCCPTDINRRSKEKKRFCLQINVGRAVLNKTQLVSSLHIDVLCDLWNLYFTVHLLIFPNTLLLGRIYLGENYLR